MSTSLQSALRALGCLSLLSLFAAPASAQNATTRHYTCDEGTSITVVIDNSGADGPGVRVSVDGNEGMQGIAMSYQPAASGEKASNGEMVWWTKGGEGFLGEEGPPAGSGAVLIGGCREVSEAAESATGQ